MYFIHCKHNGQFYINFKTKVKHVSLASGKRKVEKTWEVAFNRIKEKKNSSMKTMGPYNVQVLIFGNSYMYL